ncbi:hypothetical protein R84B8_02876 [Treponema sp. R8-4-B8]
MTKRQITLFILIMVMGITFISCNDHETKPVTYTVAFNANGAVGTVPAPQTVAAGTLITLPNRSKLSKAGSVFIGWSESSDGNDAILSPGDSVFVTKNIIFYAQWLVQYSVTFNGNGASGTPPEAQTIGSGEVIILPDIGSLNNPGNIFCGWCESPGGGGTIYTIGAIITVTRNMIFYAQWIDGSTPQYTVTFDGNTATGTPPSPQTVYRGISITIPDQGTLIKSGKVFSGWNTLATGGGTNYLTGATYTVNAYVTLYAKWVNETDAPQGENPPGSTVAEKLAYIANNAGDGTVFDIAVSSNVSMGPATVSTLGRNITVIIRSASSADIKTIQITGTGGTLFTVSNNITLKISNITLRGSAFNNINLVQVDSGGTLLIETGASITENTNNTNVSSGGLCVNGGTVIMTGGEISGNKTNLNGGGIVVGNKGLFEMRGGYIKNNEAITAAGGGVFITGNSSFIMNGGEFSGNKAKTWAGGIFCETNSVFKKVFPDDASTCGIIYGSSAPAGMANTASSGAAIHCRSKKRDMTLGYYDEISTTNLNYGWD